MSGEALPPVLLVGCGQMGGAMFDGWQAAGIAPSVVVSPSSRTVPAPHLSVVDPDSISPAFVPRMVVAAVKPVVAADALPSIGRRYPSVPVLSVMAGRRIDSIAGLLGHDAVIRAMPNTPAAIGHGISGVFAPPAVGAADCDVAERLLAAIGDVVWLPTEDQIDTVTALSGSGPAYVFLLAALMDRAVTELGLQPERARGLARATVSGAGRLLEADPRDAAALREAVTSKGGTTAAALAVLAADEAWPALVSRAIEAAAARARQLGAG